MAVLRKHQEFGALSHWVVFLAPYFLLMFGIADHRLLSVCALIYVASLILGAIKVKKASLTVRLLSFIPSMVMHSAYVVGLQAAIYQIDKLFGKPTSLSR